MQIVTNWRRALSNLPESERHFTAGYVFTVALVAVGTALVTLAWYLTHDPRVGFAGIGLIFATFIVGGVVILRHWASLEWKHRTAAISLTLCGIALLVLLVRLAASKGLLFGGAG